MKKIKILIGLLPILFFGNTVFSQQTFPVNGVAEPREGCYAFTNATIVQDGQSTLSNATLVIRSGKIISVGVGVIIPLDAVVVNCAGKYIYPSLIDIYSDYGVATPQRQQGGPTTAAAFFSQQQQAGSNTKGAFGWNQAIHSETDAVRLFVSDDAKAKPLRDLGFGTVLTHQKDGIARGTGSVVLLSGEKENLTFLKEKASTHYSFAKGTSSQSYPSSMMGSVALLRQTYLDAQWYKNKPSKEGINLSLQAWNENQSLPQFFEVTDKWGAVRADNIGDEFGVQYIIKGGTNEYQRIQVIAATKAAYILSLNFPQAQDVEDPNDARFIALNDMKHWELAPTNPAVFEKAAIPFCLTAADLRDLKQFWPNLRKAMEFGLSESKAFESLTKTPATWLGIFDKVGSIEAGKVANFLITSGPLFDERTSIHQNWVNGEKKSVKEDNWVDVKGTYDLTINLGGESTKYILDVKGTTAASVIGKDTLTAKFSHDGKMVKIGFDPSATKRRPNLPTGGDTARAAQRPMGAMAAAPSAGPSFRLSGVSNGNEWNGFGEDPTGAKLTWTASFVKASDVKATTPKKKGAPSVGKITYPFLAFGNEELPKQENLLFKNATVWTSEKAGKLENTDVLVKNGKIVQVGKNISDASARLIDATDKHLTAGIIDEHSHIASFSTNEGAQSVTSEVRIGDNINPDDINIYRQLSGGVTATHILHGSANTIGGQTQLIKMRWGVNDDQLKFKGWPGYIKFALGENVKRSSSSQGNTRYPDTRMGVEQVLTDAFTRAKEYAAALKGPDAKNVRRDLELDALVEILNNKRYITCHSYIQSEITAALRVADKLGFKINTFTHILEGYKVADKMKEHGATAATFSDWWAYKFEVQDAIPYNPTIMQRVGMNVCINSDDAEMARRLNQEAAKSIKYGGMGEEEALKMITINPAKAMHIEDKTGSIKVGKDADLVLWSYHPLSIYAKSIYTVVDGTIYFDREQDKKKREQVQVERNRLIQKMLSEKKSGMPVLPAQPSFQFINVCGDHGHSHGLLAIDLMDGN